MGSCCICEAEFGIKFKQKVCSQCKRTFCEGHIISNDLLSVTESYKYVCGLDGICYQCLLYIYEKTDKHVAPAKGPFGRTKDMLLRFKKYIFNKDPRKNVTIAKDAFQDIISKKSYVIFIHNRSISTDFIIKDLGILARVYAINMGRSGEKAISLKDIYRVVDWIRYHPKLPKFVQGITWQTLENVSVAADYMQDIWHITGGVIALANPAVGFPWAAYHLGDRAIDQVEGKGLFGWTADKIGVNINIKIAISYWIIGNSLLKLYEKD